MTSTQSTKPIILFAEHIHVARFIKRVIIYLPQYFDAPKCYTVSFYTTGTRKLAYSTVTALLTVELSDGVNIIFARL